MKKALILLVTLSLVFTFSACTTAELDSLKDLVNGEVLTSRESLATLTYLSGSLIDLDTTEETVVYVPTRLSAGDTDTEIESEIDIVNEYMDRLKVFMDEGMDSFGSAVESISDNPMYDLMITFNVDEDVYVIYYNIDPVTFEISGVLLIGDVEYTIDVTNSLTDRDDLDNENIQDNDNVTNVDQLPVFTLDELAMYTGANGSTAYIAVDGVVYDVTNEFDNGTHNGDQLGGTDATAIFATSPHSASILSSSQIVGYLEGHEPVLENNLTPTSNMDNEDDDMDNEDNDDLDSDDENDNEQEEKMILTARNGDDFVRVTYKVESDNEETETKFELESFIDGIEKEVSMKISIEENEYKLTIEENENEFTFKRELEEDGEITYKLEYEVNGVEGEVKIKVRVNDLGETVYEYSIEEGNVTKDIEKDEPDHHSDEDEDHEDEDHDDNDDDTENEA